MIARMGAARVGIAVDLVLTAVLTAWLLIATSSATDAVPRPLVLAALMTTPAAVAALGLARRRRSLLVAAAVPLLLASLLSWAFVTLPFAIVAVLYVAGAASLPAVVEPARVRALHVAQAVGVAVLVLAAGWAVLFGLTRDTCTGNAGSVSCSSAAISIDGVVVAAGLLLAAVALAALGRRPIAPV